MPSPRPPPRLPTPAPDMARRSTEPMQLGQHLRELRNRLAVSGAAVLVGAVAGWLLYDPVWRVLQSPVILAGSTDGRQTALNFTTIGAAFDLRIQLAVQLGLILSAPVWLWQVFAFIVPGLTRKEKRVTLAFVLTAVPLFVAGAGMGVWVLPHIVQVLTSFAPGESSSLLSAGDYYDFVLKLVLATGVAFVLPVFLVLLNAVGLLRGRTILRGWRIALL
ncbi:MAG: preprotein translocase subunit TatC, partial [Microbacteriaceae bacterium]|nr:preprotein translocase subunit TatC [Microbacteriaceae bacterium]